MVPKRAKPHYTFRIIHGRDDLDRNMPGGWIVLETIKDRITVHAGKRQVESYRGGTKLFGGEKRVFAVLRHQALETLLVRNAHQDPRKTVVIVDDQKHVVAR